MARDLSNLTTEGTVPFAGFETWYRTVGETDPAKLPVLCLHGGPGSPHDYLEPLAGLADSGRRVIFYDQLGCGRSTQPSDPDLWTVDLFVEEVDAVRRGLDLEQVHLLGHSWGGMVAMEYLVRGAEGVASMVLASSLSDVQLFAREADRLRADLPAEIRDPMEDFEGGGTTTEAEYDAAVLAYYRRHACRVDPWPDSLQRSFDGMRQEVYRTMWGPNETVPTGTLADWSITDRLGVLDLPVLLTSGAYDESTPALTRRIHEAIPGARWALFERSSHVAFVEETELYLAVVSRFLDEVEGRAVP